MQVKLGPKANADVNRFLKSQNDASSAGENWEASAAPAMTEQNEIFIDKLPIRENQPSITSHATVNDVGGAGGGRGPQSLDALSPMLKVSYENSTSEKKPNKTVLQGRD